MQITYKTEGDYVKSVKAECSPVEWLLISTGLELMADNSNLSIKDRRLVKKMIISIKDHDNELNNEGVLDKIKAEIEHIGKATPLIGTNTVIEIIDRYTKDGE